MGMLRILHAQKIAVFWGKNGCLIPSNKKDGSNAKQQFPCDKEELIEKGVMMTPLILLFSEWDRRNPPNRTFSISFPVDAYLFGNPYDYAQKVSK